MWKEKFANIPRVVVGFQDFELDSNYIGWYKHIEIALEHISKIISENPSASVEIKKISFQGSFRVYFSASESIWNEVERAFRRLEDTLSLYCRKCGEYMTRRSLIEKTICIKCIRKELE